MVRLKDIAAKCQVSTALVSKVLSGQMGKARVGPVKREAILRTAKELGYQPNKAAVSLRGGRKGVIAVLIHPHGTPGSELTGGLIQGVSDALANSNYNMILRFFKEEEAFLTAWGGSLKNQVDGVIVGGREHPDLHAKFKEIEDSGLPVVTVHNRTRPLSPIASKNIGTDIDMWGYLAAIHLLDAGCSRLAYFRTLPPKEQFSNPKDRKFMSALAMEKYHGFLRAHKERGAKVIEGLIHNLEDFYMEEAIRHARLLCQGGRKFDGIVTSSDWQAFGAMQYLKEHGMRVPEDVKVTGVDDSPLAQVTSITSIGTNMEKRGALAVETLLKMIERAPVGDINLFPYLVVRKSTGGSSAPPSTPDGDLHSK